VAGRQLLLAARSLIEKRKKAAAAPLHSITAFHRPTEINFADGQFICMAGYGYVPPLV